MAGARSNRLGTEPVRITTAPQSHRDDLERRRRRYVISMVIRTLCFVGAAVVGPGWVRWVLIFGAVFLPYVAVIVANSAAPRTDGADLVQPGGGYKELG
ncbi:DUF3099 domain-containing protein [Nocardioides aurantiacus]|uniref:DUF3099 domain-containing protein n=1 Tax=Nocardioides aurantiacus TaxID=86796 RepID=UPI00403FB2C6